MPLWYSYTQKQPKLKISIDNHMPVENFTLPIPCVHHTHSSPHSQSTPTRYHQHVLQILWQHLPGLCLQKPPNIDLQNELWRGGKGISSTTSTQPAAAATTTADAHPHQFQPGIRYLHESPNGRRILKCCPNAYYTRGYTQGPTYVWWAPDPTNGTTSPIYRVGQSQFGHTTPKTYTFQA